jgi:putative ABC transport system permease protein
MSTVWLLGKELAHRKLNALLSVLGIGAAVAVFVAYFTTSEAAHRETTRLARDLGFNLRIIPRDTDLERFWLAGFSEQTMPEDAVQRLAQADQVFLTFNHLVATLQGRFEAGGRPILLTGLAPAVTAPDQKKQPMGFSIPAGTVFVGHQVGQELGLKPGAVLELGAARFTVVRCLAESGTDDDLRVFGRLSDVQQVLDLPGRINEIKAIDCLCLTAEQEPLEVLRAELARILPEAKVLQLRTLADARARQRQTATKYAAFLTPCLLAAAIAWVGVLAILNVRERQLEIGILRALGYGSSRIAGLFLGRALLLGIAGAIGGYFLGSGLAVHFGPDIFPVTANSIRAVPWLGLWAVVAAPALAALASFVPAIFAVTRQPADILREA